MCKKYVNATARCYDSVYIEEKKVISLAGPFDTVKGELVGDTVRVGRFSVLTEIAIMGTNKESAQDNPINQDQKLYFTLRLTKCDKDPAKQLGTDLDHFEIDIKKLKKDKELFMACYPFYATLNVTQIKEVRFPGAEGGKYVLKVLVNHTGNPDDDIIQSMTPFTVVL